MGTRHSVNDELNYMEGIFKIKSPKCIFILLAGLFLLTAPLHSQKTDTVYLKNGDRITGELKKFEDGLLFLKTDAMETVEIGYDRIFTVYSAKFFEFRTTSGYRYYGSVLNSADTGTINIVIISDTVPKPLWDIVQITSMKNRFFQKIDGSVDVGLNYTKASDVLQFSFISSVVYRTADYSTRLDLSSIVSDQGGDLTRNNDGSIGLTRYLEGKWFANAQIKGQQNTELDLDYRLLIGLGGGYDIVRTNAQRLYVVTGVLANRERTIEEGLQSNNVELLAGVHYKWFKYRHPKIDITSGFDLYPSMTTLGRIRFEYDLAAKVEVVKDVFLGLTLYDNFDNNPSASSASKNDWGIITSLGYTF
jgi:hypothetical protein